MKCEYCEAQFWDSDNGLATMTWHTILTHPIEVNNGKTHSPKRRRISHERDKRRRVD